MEKPKRIHIIGSTGSGKTFLAKSLSKQLGVPWYELDKVMWSSSVEFAGKNQPEVREEMLRKIIDKEHWIVEGIYYKWLKDSFEKADLIIFLDTSVYKRHVRIISRFIKQRIGIERSNYKQTLRGLLKMLVWNHQFEKIHKGQILDLLKPYKDKVEINKLRRELERRI